MITITIDWLNERKACEDQVDLFRTTFGGSAEVTRDNLVRAGDVGLNLVWLAKRTLTPSQCRAFDEAVAEPGRIFGEAVSEARRIRDETTAEPLRIFDEARDRARRTYSEAIAEPWRTPDEARDRARRIYNEATAEPRRTYTKAVKTAQRTYNEAMAAVLADLLGLD